MKTNLTLNSTIVPTKVDLDEISDDGEILSDDATWILTSAFIIFTMQSGFGLLEAGMVSRKNEANIMVKNAVDVVYGGLSYWLFGFGLSFGKGAMAERTSLKAYTFYSFLNTLTYCIPAFWVWDDSGWLRKMGAVDVAGSGAVHLVGGVSGLVATIMLKPRIGRFDGNSPSMKMASPTNVMLGTFMLWWGWLGFNCGSTFGISGKKWILASRSAVVTINGSIGGGILGMLYSHICFKKKLDISVFVTGILSGLVGITAVCALCRPWEAIVIGAIGALLACPGCALLERLRIDDPVGCVPTHGVAGVWGVLAVALFAEKEDTFSSEFGIFKGGPWWFLGVQLLMIVVLIAWAACTTCLELLLVDKVFGLRMSVEEELLGADKVEHAIDEYVWNPTEAMDICHGNGRANDGLDITEDTLGDLEITRNKNAREPNFDTKTL